MNPKDGDPKTAVSPTAPDVAEDADVADPGKIAKAKAKDLETESGKYGSEEIEVHNPTEEDLEDEEKTWIEIELIDEEDNPVPGERYKITLPNGKVAQGTLNGDGFARIEGIDPGTCQITFPKLDKAAWEWA